MASGLSDVRTDPGALGMGAWAAGACLILRQLRDTVSLSVGMCLVVEVVDLMAFEDCVALRLDANPCVQSVSSCTGGPVCELHLRLWTMERGSWQTASIHVLNLICSGGGAEEIA